MDNEKVGWRDINSRRDTMLSRTDWTQLSDTRLTEQCVQEWVIWRENLRNVNDDLLDAPLDAVVKLNFLNENKPINEYNRDRKLILRDGGIISTLDIDNRIRELIRHETSFKEVIDSDSETTLDHARDFSEALEIGTVILTHMYRNRISEVSPPQEIMYIYNERLNQAVDYLADNGTSFPLLEVLATELDKPIDNIANSVLTKQRNTIAAWVEIESEYIKAQREIKEASNISDIEYVLDNF
jgi:hypothetical protein